MYIAFFIMFNKKTSILLTSLQLTLAPPCILGGSIKSNHHNQVGWATGLADVNQMILIIDLNQAIKINKMIFFFKKTVGTTKSGKNLNKDLLHVKNSQDVRNLYRIYCCLQQCQNNINFIMIMSKSYWKELKEF